MVDVHPNTRRLNTALRERLTPFHRRFQQALVALVEADLGQKLTPVMERCTPDTDMN